MQNAVPIAAQLSRDWESIGVPGTLSMRLLGDFNFARGDASALNIIPVRLQSLLAYLALHRDAPQSRQHLAFLFWPDSPEPHARNCLRQMLHQLRRAIPDVERFVCINAATLHWRPDTALRVDVADFEHALAAADSAERIADWGAMRAALEAAIGLYRAGLLPSCYDEWIVSERERLHACYLRAIERLIGFLEYHRDYPAALHYAQHLLQHEPLREDTYLCLMRLHALNDDRASVLRVYRACVTELRRELEIEPSPAIREAYERLTRTDTLPASAIDHAVLPLAAPFVGRQWEWQQLQVAWRHASAGRARFLLVAGEAGIGKSRLAEELLIWAARQGIATAHAHAYAAEGQLAYAPVADWLRSAALRPALARLDNASLTDLARLLPELLAERPDLPQPESLTEYWQRQRFFSALARAVLQASQPLLLLIDDLQWCDSETLEWLHYLVRFDSRTRLLVVGTARTEEIDEQHPLTTLLLALRRAGTAIEVPLGPLDAAESAALASNMVGGELAEEMAIRLYQETEGNPLFVVETVRAGLELDDRQIPNEPDVGNEVGPPASPRRWIAPKIHAVIAARLAQLSAPARALARLAATIGRAFAFEVLAQASDCSADSLVQHLDELCQRRIVREQGASIYDFSHDRIREVAYAEASNAHRRLLHRRVAQALEAVHAASIDLVSGQIAAHYEQAGMPEQAIGYHQRAAEVAQRVYANADAIHLLDKGLALLRGMPETPERDTREVALQTALGVSLIAIRGYGTAEVLEVYRRLWALFQRLGRPPSAPVLRGMAAASISRGEIRQAHTLGEQLLGQARDAHDAILEVEAHYLLGVTLFWLGKFADARRHLLEVVSRYGREQHLIHTGLYGQDPGVVCRSRLALDLWYLGYPAQAARQSQEALELAQELAHPLSRAYALTFAAWLSIDRRDARTTRKLITQLMTLCGEERLAFWPPTALIFQGWVLAQQGERAAGIAQMRQGIATYQATGQRLHLPYALGLLADVYGQARDAKHGLIVLAEALDMSEETAEHFYEAELYRIKGELLRMQRTAEAEACFRQALDIARSQGARSLELRAAVSLARFWQSQRRQAEARGVLIEIYSWFSEGSDTPDLHDAKALLERL